MAKSKILPMKTNKDDWHTVEPFVLWSHVERTMLKRKRLTDKSKLLLPFQDKET